MPVRQENAIAAGHAGRESGSVDKGTYDPAMNEGTDHAPEAPIHEPRLWRDGAWTARVVKNNDDEGWAVEMRLQGQAEPALIGPWTMGRDKKNPKPLDVNAFHTLVKTASEVLRRHQQAQHALLHKQLYVQAAQGRVSVTLDIVPDEDDPHAWLAAQDAEGTELARLRVAPNFRLNASTALAWVEGGCRRPG